MDASNYESPLSSKVRTGLVSIHPSETGTGGNEAKGDKVLLEKVRKSKECTVRAPFCAMF